MDTPEAIVPVVFGRSSKKRKAYRQRGGGDESAFAAEQQQPSTTTTTTTTTATSSDPGSPARDDGPEKEAIEGGDAQDDGRGEDNDNDSNAENDNDDDNDDDAVGVAVAELIRRRKQRRQKIGGVEFRDDHSLGMSRAGDIDTNDAEFDFAEPLQIQIGTRFAPQTGLIGDVVNRHMEEYVEAQLAKRHQAAEAAAVKGGSGGGDGGGGGGGGGAASGRTVPTGGASTTTTTSLTAAEAREQLAMKGKLHEIDLGTEARQRNIAMTQRATQQLRGGSGGSGGSSSTRPDQVQPVAGEDAVAATATAATAATAATSSDTRKKPGRAGRRTDRKRRNSDAIERDQIVEAFLHENKMDVDVYDVAPESVPATEGRPTDDRIAEQFRRDFMEAVALRMRRKRKPLGPPPKPKTRSDEEAILKGPKLGGSRNVRSVMRDKLLQKQEEQRQTIPKYEQQLQEERRRQGRRR